MASWQYELADPPNDARARELWMQHAAGFIVFEDARQYALEQIDPTLPAEVRASVQAGIDDAIYGLMMIMDGVSGSITNGHYAVYVDFVARLAKRAAGQEDKVVAEVDLRSGDGMCMGFHGWRDGNFGAHSIATRRTE